MSLFRKNIISLKNKGSNVVVRKLFWREKMIWNFHFCSIFQYFELVRVDNTSPDIKHIDCSIFELEYVQVSLILAQNVYLLLATVQKFQWF